MNTRVQVVAKSASPPPTWSRPITRGPGQRNGGCGSERLGAGQRNECRNESRAQSHSFSDIKVHSDSSFAHASLGSSIGINGASGFPSLGSRRAAFINGPDPAGEKKPSTPAPAPKPKTPTPAKAAANCPTDISVAGVTTVTDNDLGKDGILTGVGGFARMEVSDPTGKTWDGIEIKETVKQAKNTCGARARHVCSNKSGEGSSEGSSFKVGVEYNFLGKAKLAAAKNTFYDVHAFIDRDASILHKLGKSSCEVECEQAYFCGGKQIGPEFVVTYKMTKDQVAKFYDVTRVGLQKQAKAKSAPAPPAPSSGAKP